MPGSDIDVVLIHPQRAGARLRSIAEPLWYPMWNTGVKLSSPAAHSVKSLLALASSDLVTATAILRLRHLAGGEGGVSEIVAAGLDQWRKKALGWLRPTAHRHRRSLVEDR